MIIQSLEIVLEEADVATWVRNGLSAVNQVKDLTFGLEPGIVRLGGKFQVGFSVPFETQWSVDVLESGRRLGVRLAHVSVGFLGMSAETVSAQVMGALAKKVQGVAGMAVENDIIMIEPAVLLASKGIRLNASIKRIEVKQGCVKIEV